MRVIVTFKNNRSKKVWVKSFLSVPSARRAVAGITKKTRNNVLSSSGEFLKSPRRLQIINAKGMRYGRDVKMMNKKRY
ncbi:MAG: hypothetical protein RLZZ236_1941 [Bacteroidota bacterium]|jgi:hypothetical protein